MTEGERIARAFMEHGNAVAVEKGAAESLAWEDVPEEDRVLVVEVFDRMVAAGVIREVGS